MKVNFLVIIFLDTWIHFNALAGQMPASLTKPVAAPTKVSVAKNLSISGNLQHRGWGPMSVGGPEKAINGTGITGTAGAHKH